MPTAIYPGGANTGVTYKIVGTGVTLSSQTLTRTVDGTQYSYSSSYYDLGNGITYNYNASGTLNTSSSTASASAVTYQWRAVSYYSKYSEIDLTITVSAALDFTQTSTTVSLQVGASSSHVLDAPTNAVGTVLYAVFQGEFDATTAYLTDHGCATSPEDLYWSCRRAHFGIAKSEEFAANLMLEFVASTRTLRLKSPFYSGLEHGDLEQGTGSQKITVAAYTSSVDGVFDEADHVVLTVNISPPDLAYADGADSGTLNLVAGGEWSSFYVPLPDGGVRPYSVSVSPSWPEGWSFGGEGGLSDLWGGVIDLWAGVASTEGDDSSSTAYTITVTDSSTTPQSVDYTLTVVVSDG